MGVGEGAGTRCPGLGPEPLTASAPWPLAALVRLAPQLARPLPRGTSREGAPGPTRRGRGGREGVNLLAGPCRLWNGALVAPRGSQGALGGSQGVRAIHALQSSLLRASHQDLGVPRFPHASRACFLSLLDHGGLAGFLFFRLNSLRSSLMLLLQRKLEISRQDRTFTCI